MRTPWRHVSLIILAAGLVSGGAEASVWSDVDEAAIGASAQERLIVPQSYRTLAIDGGALAVVLAQAPEEGVESNIVLELPMPDGGDARFYIWRVDMMAPELAERYPEITTFRGRGIDDPSATAVIDRTPAGFHAMVLRGGDTIYIDPYRRNDTVHYISYFRSQYGTTDSAADFVCHVEGETATPLADPSDGTKSTPDLPSGSELLTYRTVVAATGEYTAFHGGTVPAGMAAIVTAMNRVSGIYEREVAIRMELVANNDQVVYTNAATDPYSNNNGFTMLGQNQSNVDAVIGSANYDIGHVFSTGGGGVAGLGVPCRAGNKARGVTGLPSPIGDPFYVDYVAHEMGHQWGANHTFNGSSGSCAGGNRWGPTAYEPGSGSTIMAYAGICAPQNIQNFSDDYFHGVSFDEIISYSTLGSGNSCAAVTATGNSAPSVEAGLSYTIPINTPFALTGSATDPESDPLTYCWEEFDRGNAGHPNSPVGNAPIFRSFDPVSSPMRSFPRTSDLVNNTQTIGEILPSYSRTMNFRLTARDNRVGGGGVDYDTTTIVASDTAGPFLVNAPNTAVTWNGAGPHPVNWDAAGTTAAPISCGSVNILLSVDGGLSFDQTLVSTTPNDGVAEVWPATPDTTAARVKVVCSDNIFFDISNENFTIIGAEGTIFVDGFESGNTNAWSSATP
jgi:hypothetical protein